MSDLEIAETLLDLGVPVFWAWLRGEDDHPSRPGWENIEVDEGELEKFAAPARGRRALCARTGIVFDVIDYDPRNDTSGSGLKELRALFRKLRPVIYLRVTTPSGGWHWWVASLGLAARKCRIEGVDYLGYGRLVFIPPTARRPKDGSGRGPVEYSVASGSDNLSADIVPCPGLSEILVRSESERALTPDELVEGMRTAREGARNYAFYPYVYRMQTLFGDSDVVDMVAPFILSLGWHRTLEACRDDVRRHLAKGGKRPAISAMPGSLRFRPSSAVIPRNVSWALQDRAPRGAFVLCAGRGGEGKSHAVISWAADWTRGKVEGCWKGEPVSVLWATVESSLDVEVVPRYRAAHGDLRRLSFVTVESAVDDHIRIFDPAYIEELRARVIEDGIRVIVLDPVLDVLESDLKTGEQQAVRAAIGRLNSFAEEEDILILGIAHFNKMTNVSSAVDRITGSAAFSQRPRAVMAFAYDRESETFVVSQAKNNWGKTFLPSLSFRIRDAVCTYKRKGSSAVVINTSAVEWGSESAVSVDEILGQGRDGRSLKPSPKTDECRKWLVGILNSPVGEGRLSSNIVTVGSELDYSKPLIYKVAKELGVFMEEAPKDLVRGGRGRPPVLWSLPEKVRLNDLVGINAYILITTNYILINIA